MIFRYLFSRRWWLTTVLILAGMGLTIRLGIWQVDRYHQNKTISDHLAAMQAAAPIILRGGIQPDGLTGMEYRAVRATGTYDFAHQIAVRNQVWVQSWGNEMGFDLVTPLVFPDGSAVLVERGWIPLKDNTPAEWRKYDVPGPVSVSGIIRLPVMPSMGGQGNPTLAPGQKSLDFWNLIDLSRLQKQMPYAILPIYIQQGAQADTGSLPYPAAMTPELTAADTNAGFASMWFGFTLLLVVGYPLYLLRQSPDIGRH
jgi:cytochrome oxidase assembly protein ShyY1